MYSFKKQQTRGNFFSRIRNRRHTHNGSGSRHAGKADRQPAEVHTPTLDKYPVTGVFSTLIPALQRAVHEMGYTEPTPIQTQAIPHLLDHRDLYGCAQTGTGKTAAFALPLLQHLAGLDVSRQSGRPQALILAPTRELACQISDSIKAYARYTGINHTTVYGGVGQQPQVNALRRGVNIVVATPGRLMDLIEQKAMTLASVTFFVLDEGDRMLDMGFMPDIQRIVQMLPAQRQSLLFSATLPRPIMELANKLTKNPVHIAIAPEKPVVERIAQKVLFVDQENKIRLLIGILQDSSTSKVLVFAQMKHAANKIAEKLEKAGIQADAIHGNKSQNARTKALSRFKTGGTRVLVATDVAARGIDVADVSHVINYDLPLEAETYIHRIGRTARAGATGKAVSFCSSQERELLGDIERLLCMAVPADLEHALHSETARHARGAAARPPPRGGGGRSQQSRQPQQHRHQHKKQSYRR